MNDNLTIGEVEEAIIHGRILEEYPNTGRGESVRVAGFAASGKPIHVVLGEGAGQPVIVTVYIPGPPKFKDVLNRSG